MSLLPENNVWQSLGENVVSLFAARERRKAAEAAPGKLAPANPNPLFGNWSVFPQNDTKQQYQNATPFSALRSIPSAWLIIGGALLLLFVLMKAGR